MCSQLQVRTHFRFLLAYNKRDWLEKKSRAELIKDVKNI